MGQPTPPAPPAPQPPTGATPPATDPSTTPPATPPAPAPAPGDQALGEAGLKALQAERDARQKLEKELAALEPLKGLAAALGVQPGARGAKTEIEALTERIAAQEQRATEAELRATRLEVAAEKGLTAAQAARLQGMTREELAADADQLKALFPAAPAASSGAPGTPAPDPTQGARGGSVELAAAIKAAQDKGDIAEVMRLKSSQLLTVPTPQH